MNKNILLIVGAIAVLGIVGYMLMGSSPEGGTVESGANNAPGTPPAQGMRSLKDLLAVGSAQKCTFTQSAETGGSSGVVYTAGGRMRGDFTSNAAGQTMESHMIVKDDTSYMWGAGMEQGIKMSFASIEDAQANAPQGTRSVDVNQKLDYDCGGWSADGRMFELPGDIEFMDMSSMMEGMMNKAMPQGIPSEGMMPNAPNGTLDMKAMQCKACDSAPPEAQAECRAALGCN